MDREEVEAKHAEGGFELDLMRGEPVEPLATVEEQLQGPDAEAERREAKPIEPSGQWPLGAPAEEQQDPERAEPAERHVDVEHPAPAVRIREPAAERRPH